MRVYEEKPVQQKTMTDLLCDCCGRSCFKLELGPMEKDFIHSYAEYALLTANWGYGSSRDGDRWECDLCETCALKVKEFIESLGGSVRIAETI